MTTSQMTAPARAGEGRTRPTPPAAGVGRRWLVVVGVVWLVTRLASWWVLDHRDEVYGPSRADVVSDVWLYRHYDDELRTGASAYRDLAIEYPPGALAFMAAPSRLPGVGYLDGFVAQMLVVDAVGLVALVRLGRAHPGRDGWAADAGAAVLADGGAIGAGGAEAVVGVDGTVPATRTNDSVNSSPVGAGNGAGGGPASAGPQSSRLRGWTGGPGALGAWAWVLVLPLLGPVAWARIDLVVGVSLVLAVERAAARRWGTAGVALGVGAAVKLVPALALPVVLVVAPRGARPRLLAGFGTVVGASALPFVGQVPAMVSSVLGYHQDRGVHLQSAWGLAQLWADLAGWVEAEVVGAFGAFDVASPLAGVASVASNLCAIAAVAVILVATARRWGATGTPTAVAWGVGATVLATTAVGRVFSPQYLVWATAAVAVLASLGLVRRSAVVVLAATAVLSHLEYPVLLMPLLDREGVGALGVASARAVGLVVVAALAMRPGVRARSRRTVTGRFDTGDHEEHRLAGAADRLR